MKSTAKSQKSQPTRKQPKTTFNKKMLILVLATLIGITLLGALLYNNHQNNLKNERAVAADKARFAQVEKDMQIVEAAMITSDELTMLERRKSCSYSSTKFGIGTLNCAQSVQFAYSNSDIGAINEAGSTLETRLSKLSIFSESSPLLLENTIRHDGVSQKRIMRYVETDSMKCDLELAIDKDTQKSELHSAIITFKCAGEATKPIYPLAE